MKLWYFSSLLFFILSVLTLIEDRYMVIYESNEDVNKTKTESFDYLVCIPLKEIYPNRFEFDLHQLKNELYEYFNRSKSSINKYRIKMYENVVLHAIKRNNYLIKSDQFCLSKIKEDDLKKFKKFNYIFKKQRRFVIHWDTYNMVEINNYLGSYDILVVLNREYPYSNCAENYSKFKCLNKCFKEKNRLSKYLYTSNEIGEITKLNYDDNIQILKKNENKCFKDCEREDCKLVYILPIYKKWSTGGFKFIESRPLIPPFDYWAQLIGLFVLFSNICLYQIYTLIINKINLKVNKRPENQRFLTIFRYATLILLGFGFLAFPIVKVIDFENQRSNPTRRVTTYRSIESNSFSIVFCMKVNNIDKNVTFSTLEQESNDIFNKFFKEIYLHFENKKKLVDFTLHPKIIFIYFGKYFHRCFHLVPHWKEIRYQSLFTTSKLKVESKNGKNLLYLIPDDQNFNSKSYYSFPYINYIKKITKRSKLKNCVEYRELNSNFKNRWDTVDRCINRKYKNKTRKFSYYSIIDRDDHTDDEWKQYYVDRNEAIFNETVIECEKENKEKDCYEIEFDKGNQITRPDNKRIHEIDLYTQVEKVTDEDPSIYKILLDILNILSILFGLSVFYLLHLIYLLTKIKFKLCLLLIYLLCSIGLTYHIYYILNEVINEDLIYSEHYEVVKSYKTAETIFCFDFNQNMIDKNYKLTGNYLKKITNEMRAETVFKNISYLSKSNEWITLNSTLNYTNDELKIEIFFFVNKRCFKLKQQVEYDQNQLYFSFDSKVLEIYFNRPFIHQEKRMTHMMSRVENSMQFTKNVISFKYFGTDMCIYSIYQEPFEFIHEDKFYFIKNPLSLFYGENDVNKPDKYLKGLINFKKGLSTLNLPLEEEIFNNEIDDDLFEQYYLQVQNITDHQTATNSNYKRIFATNHFNRNVLSTSKPDLALHLIQFKKKLTITNSDNFTKLLLNLLNAFSTWFGLGVFELDVYVHLLFQKIKSILTFTCWLILNFKRFILIRL